MEYKQLKSGKGTVQQDKHYDLSVMKPFVKFGWGAMKIIAHALIAIVKSIPKPHDEVKPSKNNKIIKIS